MDHLMMRGPAFAKPWGILLLGFLAIVTLIPSSSLHAANLPAGFTESQFGGTGANMASPTAMAFAPDGRLFVCTQGGSLYVIKNGVLLATPFLTVPVDASGERGLLGVAIPADFAVHPFVYIYYTTSTAPIHNRVSRFTANGDTAVPGSEVVILDLDDLSTATNHNGGAIHFGPDGKLYIAAGENGNSANAQTLSNLLGKILRIDPDGSIPADNPFFTQTTGKNRGIWALGLRNPFTFSFQPGTSRIFINDVGQGIWEEINNGIAGANYGWPNCEGNCNPTNPSFTDPIYQYIHDGTTCAIVGGAFYNPAVPKFPAQYTGKYFFADLCAGWIHMLDPADNTVSEFGTGLSVPVDLQVGPDGALYYLQRGNGGQVWRVAFIRNTSDFNGDGRSDIVWRNTASGDIDVWFMNGATVTGDGWLPPVRDPQWQIAGIGDFNGDGNADILWIYTPTGDLNLWLMQGLAVMSDAWIARAGSSQWVIAGIGDFSNDAQSDIVWRNTVTGDINVWFMNGAFVTGDAWLPRVIDQLWQITGIGDLDSDGRSDIVWTYLPTQDRNVWFMSGTTVVSDAWLAHASSPLWQINALGDFTGNGNAEILWRHNITGDMNIWFMNGAAFISDAWLPRVADLQWQIYGPK